MGASYCDGNAFSRRGVRIQLVRHGGFLREAPKPGVRGAKVLHGGAKGMYIYIRHPQGKGVFKVEEDAVRRAGRPERWPCLDKVLPEAANPASDPPAAVQARAALTSVHPPVPR